MEVIILILLEIINMRQSPLYIAAITKERVVKQLRWMIERIY